MGGFRQGYGKNPGLSIAQQQKLTSFSAGEGKIGTMERSESIPKNVLISCGVLFLTAALVVSLAMAGGALFVALGG
jgi:hypothetical protein